MRSSQTYIIPFPSPAYSLPLRCERTRCFHIRMNLKRIVRKKVTHVAVVIACRDRRGSRRRCILGAWEKGCQKEQ